MKKTPVYRNEIKILCDKTRLSMIENVVRSICFPDPHAGDEGKYLIRSIYFDTPDDLCYMQTKNGLDRRAKYRIRIYNKSDDHINLERKESLNGKKRKITQLLTPQMYKELISDNVLPEADGLISIFSNDIRIRALSPKVIVEYLRTPYVYPAGNVRITFDENIFAAKGDIFTDSLDGISVLPNGKGILEIKYDEVLPGALARCLNGFELKPSSFSKYVACREALNGIIGGYK